MFHCFNTNMLATPDWTCYLSIFLRLWWYRTEAAAGIYWSHPSDKLLYEWKWMYKLFIRCFPLPSRHYQQAETSPELCAAEIEWSCPSGASQCWVGVTCALLFNSLSDRGISKCPLPTWWGCSWCVLEYILFSRIYRPTFLPPPSSYQCFGSVSLVQRLEIYHAFSICNFLREYK